MLRKRWIAATITVYVCLSVALAVGEVSAADVRLSSGQTVYVPIYSHIYSGDRERPVLLAATLSIRNTDPRNQITITTVDYYDSNGKLIKHFLDQPLQLAGMASTRYVIGESDKSGGSGANFIVKWAAQKKINPPIIEAVMISTKMQQGISFISRGHVIQEAGK
jgi:hypothetical protein